MHRRYFWSGMLLTATAIFLCACATPGPDAEFDTGYTPIRSETLFSARYYETDETLVVVRRTGDVLEYRGVPQALAEAFFAAEDKDAFFREHLEGRFGETKAELVESPEAEATAPAAVGKAAPPVQPE